MVSFKLVLDWCSLRQSCFQAREREPRLKLTLTVILCTYKQAYMQYTIAGDNRKICTSFAALLTALIDLR